MHAVSEAICIQAQAPDLGFLNDVRNSLRVALADKFRSFKIGDIPSHSDAKRALASAGSTFVVIFAHGGSDYVRGGEYSDRLSGETRIVERFLERKDLGIFRGKVVFCMSCQSANLAADAIEAGAVAFVGFDQIPFHRLDANENVISSGEFNRHAQRLIASAIQSSLLNFITGRLTLDQAVDFTRLWICQKAVRFVREPKRGVDCRNIAALLLKVKDGLCYRGITDVRFVQHNG
jgi:hypothetical protein